MLHIKRRKSVPYQSFALSPPTHPLCRPSAVLRTGDALAEASDTVMIRAFSLLLKLKTSGLSDLHLFEILTETALRCPGPCPSCGSSFPAYRQMQPYSRFMISAENGKRVERQISVQRLRCSLCGHSHAILPECLIPYGSYTVGFILAVLEAYLSRKSRVDTLCDQWQISISTLYSWIHRFQKPAERQPFHPRSGPAAVSHIHRFRAGRICLPPGFLRTVRLLFPSGPSSGVTVWSAFLIPRRHPDGVT